MRKAPDTLGDIKGEIEAAAAAAGFAIFPTDLIDIELEDGGQAGWRQSKTRDIVVWGNELDSWPAYLDIARQMKVSMLYIHATAFSWDIDLFESLNHSEELSNDEKAARRKALDDFKTLDGFIEDLQLAFKANGVWHLFKARADWADEYAELLEAADPDGDQEEDPEAFRVQIESAASKLARDVGFGSLGRAARIRKAEGLLREDQSQFAWNVLEKASAIYELEVQPEEDKRLWEKIRKLLAEGNSRAIIARNLGLGPAVVSRVIRRFAPD